MRFTGKKQGSTPLCACPRNTHRSLQNAEKHEIFCENALKNVKFPLTNHKISDKI